MPGRWCFGPAAILFSVSFMASAQEIAPAEGASVDMADRPSMNVALPGADQGCGRAITTEGIVVCGRRETASYRLDPRLMAARRRTESGPVGPSAASQLLVSCSDTSARGCPGQGVVPESGTALTLFRVILAAATGDDWKDPLRSDEPDEYEVYRSTDPD